jgi:hypothetical protein
MLGGDELPQLLAINAVGVGALLCGPAAQCVQVTPVGIQRVRRGAALHLQVTEEFLGGVHAVVARRRLRPGRSA